MVVLVRLPVAQVCLMPDYRAQRCKFDLTDEESSALRKSLTDAIEYDRYPLSPRVQMLRGILMKFGPMAPQPPPPARPPTPDARLGARGSRRPRDPVASQRDPGPVPWHLCDLPSMPGTLVPRGGVGQPTIDDQKNPQPQPHGSMRPIEIQPLWEGCRCDHLPRHTPRPRNPHRRRLL